MNIKTFGWKEKLDKSFFDGDFSIKDENIDFSFKGLVNFSDSVPAFNVKANINKIKLKALKFAKEDIVVSGLAEMNFRGKNEDDMQGFIKLNKLNFNYLRHYFFIDSLVVHSEVTPYQYRKIDIQSEVLNGCCRR